jgi:ATP-dependent helicase/DNAse subunit B
MRAQARVHGIGQTKEVKVIRLVARATVEAIILERAQRKLTFSSAILGEEGEDTNDDTDEIKSIEQLLLHGASAPFEKATFSNDNAASIKVRTHVTLGAIVHDDAQQIPSHLLISLCLRRTTMRSGPL